MEFEPGARKVSYALVGAIAAVTLSGCELLTRERFQPREYHHNGTVTQEVDDDHGQLVRTIHWGCADKTLVIFITDAHGELVETHTPPDNAQVCANRQVDHSEMELLPG